MSSQIEIYDIGRFTDYLSKFLNGITTIQLDKKNTSYFYFNKFKESLIKINDLKNLTINQALKNPIEVKGMLKANIQDGSAICKLLYWIKSNIDNLQY